MKKDTKDVYFAAALLALGATLSNVDKSDPRHMTFSLISPPNSIDLDRVELEWGDGTLLVNAVRFKEALQRLKTIIHTNR